MSVRIEVVDESGKVDLNAADVGLLARLFTVVGVDQATAGDIAAAIADWRDADDLTQPQGGAEDPAYARAEIGRAHVWTPVTNAHLVCRLLLEKRQPPSPTHRTT